MSNTLVHTVISGTPQRLLMIKPFIPPLFMCGKMETRTMGRDFAILNKKINSKNLITSFCRHLNLQCSLFHYPLSYKLTHTEKQ
jgi:hypothetical protein